MAEPAPRYYGTARFLRPGDPVAPGAAITTDAARALADSWRASATPATDRSSFVYEVAERDGALIIVDGVLVSSQLGTAGDRARLADHRAAANAVARYVAEAGS